MRFRSESRYLVMLMILFMVVVFLDQNSTPVPLKMLFGNPFQWGLSLIIVISMLVGAIITVCIGYLLMKRRKHF
jgi:uncharacterized integral membrane protein